MKDSDRWFVTWLDAVASGASTMSQRRLSSVEARDGGVSAMRKFAKARGVHLLLAVDEEGREIVLASRHPFKVLC